MDGNRPAGPQCQSRTPCDVDDGTRIRTQSPRPGPIRRIRNQASPQPATRPLRVTNWPSRLNWRQFRQVRSAPEGTSEDAQTAADIQGSPRVQIGTDQGRLFLRNPQVVLTLITQGSVDDVSWVVQGKQTDALLKHEQGHWDISGLAARDLLRAFVALRASDRTDLESQISTLLQQSKATADRIGQQYDDETDHSRNAQKQKQWEDRIAAWMADPDGTLP